MPFHIGSRQRDCHPLSFVEIAATADNRRLFFRADIDHRDPEFIGIGMRPQLADQADHDLIICLLLLVYVLYLDRPHRQLIRNFLRRQIAQINIVTDPLQ